jgi:hypothetical protein
MNAIPVDRADRTPRVPFRQPVRVVPLGGPPRAFRVLAGNLSKGGMFLNTDQPFDEGTKVALSLEASGRVLPFAQAEVVWRKAGEGRTGQGFGVKFTGFLHPRAHEMVNYLVKAIESGEPLHVDGSKPHSWKQVAFAGGAALLAGAIVTAGFLALFGGSSEPVEDVAPAPVVTAPVAEPTRPVIIKGDAPAVEAAPAPVVTAPEPIKEEPTVKTIDLKPMVLNVPEPKPAAAPAAAPEGKGLALPSGAATKMTWARSGDGIALTLTLAPGAKVQKAFLLQNPPRLAIDVSGGAPKKSHTLDASDASLFHRVRVGRGSANTTRLVVDLARAGKKVETSGNRIVVTP